MKSLSRKMAAVGICTVMVWGASVATAIPEARGASGGGELRIQGSWAGRDVMRALARQFEKRPDGAFVSFLPRDSQQVAPLLARNRLQVGLVLDCEVPSAERDLGLECERYSLGRFVLVVVVNAKNRTRRITLEELARVYRGRIRLWQQIDNSGHAGRIELYAPLLATTEGCVFRTRVLHGAPYAKQLRESSGQRGRQKLTNDEVLGAVIKNRDAIGFILCGYEGELDKRVRVLGIAPDPEAKAVLPSVQTIRDGSYPLSDTLSFYLRPYASPLARQFCAFAVGPEAAKTVKGFRLFPDYEWQQHAARLRLAEMAAGKGPRITVVGAKGGAALMEDLAREFVKVRATVQLQYQPVSQGEAVRRFLNGGGLLLVDGPLEERITETYGRQWDALGPQAVPLGRMVVGPVVHPTNPVGSLTVTQLQGIYTAHIPSWSELKGSRTSIRLYGLSSDSPIEQLLREKLGVNRLSVRVIRRSATAQVVAAVARDPTAIGFVDLSELSPKDSSVKLLKVVLPEKPFGVSARDDDYPLARAYTLYAAPGMDETTREFARFLMSGRGAGVIVRHGLLPSTPLPEGPLRGTEAARR